MPKRYSDEFRFRALALIKSGVSVAQVAYDLYVDALGRTAGITPESYGKWLSLLSNDDRAAMAGFIDWYQRQKPARARQWQRRVPSIAGTGE